VLVIASCLLPGEGWGLCVGWKCNEREKGQLVPSGHVLGGLSCILMHERMVAFVRCLPRISLIPLMKMNVEQAPYPMLVINHVHIVVVKHINSGF
jgi:hypothetical protein